MSKQSAYQILLEKANKESSKLAPRIDSVLHDFLNALRSLENIPNRNYFYEQMVIPYFRMKLNDKLSPELQGYYRNTLSSIYRKFIS